MIIRQTAVAGTLESSDVMVTIRPAENLGLTINIQSIVQWNSSTIRHV